MCIGKEAVYQHTQTSTSLLHYTGGTLYYFVMWNYPSLFILLMS